jgi:hypothetical protein
MQSYVVQKEKESPPPPSYCSVVEMKNASQLLKRYSIHKKDGTMHKISKSRKKNEHKIKGITLENFLMRCCCCCGPDTPGDPPPAFP